MGDDYYLVILKYFILF